MEIIRTQKEIDSAINKEKLVLLYFGMDSCVVCVDLLPKIEKMLKKFPKIKSYEIDAAYDRSLSAKHGVFTAPVIVLYIDGKETIREARHISIPELENKIQRYYDMLQL